MRWVFSYNLSEFPEINTISYSFDKIIVVTSQNNFDTSIIDYKHFSIQPLLFSTSSINILSILKYQNYKNISAFIYRIFEIEFKFQKPRKVLTIKNTRSAQRTINIVL